MIGTQPYPAGEHHPYYVALGRGSDAIARCAECQRLVTDATLKVMRGCPCGCRKVKEVRRLSLWEWFTIRVGLVRFPYRREFLHEFNSAR